MKMNYCVFQLQNAVSGIENTGIIYDDRSFVLNYCGTFENKNKAIKYIEDELQDRAERGFYNTRFVIKEVYHTSKDDIFR